MRHSVIKLGRIKLIFIITAISTFLAISIDYTIAQILNHSFEMSEDLVRASIIPLVIAPFISWYLVGILFEIDSLEKKMELLATYDDLTGFMNRRSFFNSCDVLHNYSMRNKQNYSIVSIDFDYFKKINDKYGHAAGDEVLSSFGRISGKLSRKSDILGRLGGEEFVFFLPDTNLNQARSFTEKLCEAIKNTKVTCNHTLVEYTISIGIAVNQCDANMTLEEVIKNSDEALYTAKNTGRNQTVLYK